jgi:hypothetical protein
MPASASSLARPCQVESTSAALAGAPAEDSEPEKVNAAPAARNAIEFFGNVPSPPVPRLGRSTNAYPNQTLPRDQLEMNRAADTARSLAKCSHQMMGKITSTE